MAHLQSIRAGILFSFASRDFISGVGVGLRLRDLQVLLGQVVHFVLNWSGDWVVDGVMCR